MSKYPVYINAYIIITYTHNCACETEFPKRHVAMFFANHSSHFHSRGIVFLVRILENVSQKGGVSDGDGAMNSAANRVTIANSSKTECLDCYLLNSLLPDDS